MNLPSRIAGLLLAFITMTSHAIEEPSYTVVRQLDGIAIREYQPYTVAEVVVSGEASEAANRAFPILAGYIYFFSAFKNVMKS
jgi:hypothetical protein